MKRSVLVRGARQLLTLHGPSGPRRGEALRSVGLIEDGSVLIVDGVISHVGPTRRVENLADARSAEEINASGRVVMPGFVDSHTHLISAPARALSNHRPMTPVDGESIPAAINYIRNTPAASLDYHARRQLERLFRHGTTTVEAKSGYGLNVSSELKMLRVLAGIDGRPASVLRTFFGAHTLPPECSSPELYLQSVCESLVPKLKERNLARFVDVFCGPSGFRAEDTRAFLSFAKRHGLGVKVHADQAVRCGGVRLAVEFEAISADGLNAVESEDVELLARSSTIATLLPGTVHHGGFERFPPARELIERGAAVALASAFSPGCPSTFNMQMIVSLACTHMNLLPEEAIAAATVNGAYAVGEGKNCGSLESGKQADLLILDVSDYREISMHFGCNIVALAMRKGHVIYKEGARACVGE